MKIEGTFPRGRRKDRETAGDRNLRLLAEVAVWASRFPCQNANRPRCECAPCAAKRLVRDVPIRAASERFPLPPYTECSSWKLGVFAATGMLRESGWDEHVAPLVNDGDRLSDLVEMKLNLVRRRKARKVKLAAEQGWAIVHPSGKVETDYFHVKWAERERKQWHKTYRPDCKMVRATLILRNESR